MTSQAQTAFRQRISTCQPSNYHQRFILLLYRVVLQRQFFEAIVRAAAVKYANRPDLPTLADKLDALFKGKLSINATKNKAKSVEEEVIY